MAVQRIPVFSGSGALGSWAAGEILDLNGSYLVAFASVAAVGALALTTSVLLKRIRSARTSFSERIQLKN